MTKTAENEENLNKKDTKEEDMARCPICKQRVTGERGGGVWYNGRLYHRSCLSSVIKKRLFKRKTLSRFFE